MLYSQLRDKIKKRYTEHTYWDYLTLLRVFMFKYKNLNFENDIRIIPRRLEMILRMYGMCALFKIRDGKYKGQWVACECNIGGGNILPYEGLASSLFVTLPDGRVYEIKNYLESDEVIVVYNNTLGLSDDMIDMIAAELTEINTSIRVATVNTRFSKIFEAPNSLIAEGINKVLEQAKMGYPQVVTSNLDIEKTLNGVNLSDKQESTIINELLSNHENICKRFYSFYGLNMIDGDKKAQMNEDEINNGSSAALSLPYDMLKCRKEAFEKFNKITGLNITPEFSECLKHEEDRLMIDLKDKDTETKRREKNEEREGVENAEKI